ncbi:sterile alpha motif domain-containing protein 12-like [Lissotriton helveticus]
MEPSAQDTSGGQQLKHSALKKPPSQWSVKDVCHWLRSWDFADSATVVDLAEIHAISGRALLRLTDEKLEKMGVGAKSQRRDLMERVLKLRLEQEVEDLLLITEA